MSSFKVILTAEDRLDVARSIIDELHISNDDLKQDIYLKALETEIPENVDTISGASALGLDLKDAEYVLLKESIMHEIVAAIRKKKHVERYEESQGLIGVKQTGCHSEGSKYNQGEDDINLLLALLVR